MRTICDLTWLCHFPLGKKDVWKCTNPVHSLTFQHAFPALVHVSMRSLTSLAPSVITRSDTSTWFWSDGKSVSLWVRNIYVLQSTVGKHVMFSRALEYPPCGFAWVQTLMFSQSDFLNCFLESNQASQFVRGYFKRRSRWVKIRFLLEKKFSGELFCTSKRKIISSSVDYCGGGIFCFSFYLCK